jgi:hypothetical protein
MIALHLGVWERNGGAVRLSNQLSWFVEMRGATLWSRDSSVRHSIPYPHAALWALIVNGNYNKTSAAEMMSIPMSVDRQDAEREVKEMLAVWRQAGLVSEE